MIMKNTIYLSDNTETEKTIKSLDNILLCCNKNITGFYISYNQAIKYIKEITSKENNSSVGKTTIHIEKEISFPCGITILFIFDRPERKYLLSKIKSLFK